MRYQRITNRGEPIMLGYRGENNATLVSFDIPDDWTEGVVQLYVLRMSDTEPYVPGGFYIEDGIAYWRVSSADTAIVGNGLAQYCSIVNGVITKTRTFKTIIEASASNSDIVVPEPQKSILDASLEAASEFATDAQTAAGNAQISAQAASDAQTGAETAQGKAETAQDKAEDAQAAAESAAQTAQSAIYDWFTVQVDTSTGHLMVTERSRQDGGI